MIEENRNVTFEIRVSEGKAGLDPEDGVVKDNSNIYDNLTLAEAQQIAGMWTKKKEEAEGSAE